MALEIAGELHLDIEETRRLRHQMMHPNQDVLNRRDAFLAELDNFDILFTDGEIEVDCPDLCLPVLDMEIYDVDQSITPITESESVHIFHDQEIPQAVIDELFAMSNAAVKAVFSQPKMHTFNSDDSCMSDAA